MQNYNSQQLSKQLLKEKKGSRSKKLKQKFYNVPHNLAVNRYMAALKGQKILKIDY